MTAEHHTAKRRYMIRFLGAMMVYSVLIMITGRTIRHVDPTWAKVLLSLLPIIPIGVALSELLRFVASLDELQRRAALVETADQRQRDQERDDGADQRGGQLPTGQLRR